ncbi:MAG: tetratricopeptide repeat protein [Pseudomonadota bacterium]
MLIGAALLVSSAFAQDTDAGKTADRGATTIDGPVPLEDTSATENPTAADDAPSEVDVAKSGAADADPDINGLLDELKSASDEDAARSLTRRIQLNWNRSGSPAIDLLMQRATRAMRARNFPVALDLLDTVIVLAPDYAEGWNRRATVHFMKEDYALSIADVEQVLRLEPRHFGALSGIGIMLDELGQYAAAANFLKAALDVHPFLPGAKSRLDVIERRLEGSPI